MNGYDNLPDLEKSTKNKVVEAGAAYLDAVIDDYVARGRDHVMFSELVGSASALTAMQVYDMVQPTAEDAARAVAVVIRSLANITSHDQKALIDDALAAIEAMDQIEPIPPRTVQ